MDKQKQIEEMAKVLSTVERCDALAVSECIKKKCEYPHYSGVPCIAEHQAEALYNAGCRKIPEGAVVLTREELQEHDKELAEKFAERLKEKSDNAQYIRKDNQIDLLDYFDDIDEICKEFTGGAVI